MKAQNTTDAREAADAAPRRPLAALLLLVPAPTLGAVGMLFWFAPPLNTIWSAFLKLWLFVLPAVWHRRVDRGRWTWPALPKRGWAMAFGSGLLIAAIILAAYYTVGRAWIDAEAMRDLAGQRGFDNLALYLGIAVYICLVNALLEEYVWRWFVFRQSEALVRRAGPAIALSATLFTIHHIFALAAWFDWRLVLLGSIGVWIGGATWSWLYLRYRSVWPPYISHIFADVAIFWIGYELIFMSG